MTTPTEELATAERAAKRNGIIAIIVACVTLLLVTLVFAMFNTAQTARAQADALKVRLEACEKKQVTAPSLPAAPAPATGNGSCVTQETHVTIYGSSKPSASQPVKVQKKAPTTDKAALPKKEATAPAAKKVWGNIPYDATPAKPKKCFTSQAVSGSKPNSCSEVEVETPWVKGLPRKDGTLAPFTEDEEAWTKRMAASYGIAIGKNLGDKAIRGLNVNQENPK